MAQPVLVGVKLYFVPQPGDSEVLILRKCKLKVDPGVLRRTDWVGAFGPSIFMYTQNDSHAGI